MHGNLKGILYKNSKLKAILFTRNGNLKEIGIKKKLGAAQDKSPITVVYGYFKSHLLNPTVGLIFTQKKTCHSIVIRLYDLRLTIFLFVIGGVIPTYDNTMTFLAIKD